MSRCPFVIPKIVRIPLPHDEWLDVKAELTAGEEREMYASMRQRGLDARSLDLTLIGRQRMVAYVLGWSFTGPDGAPAPVSAEAFDQLDRQTFGEIRDALDAHEAALERAQQEKKTIPVGVTSSDPTLPSAA